MRNSPQTLPTPTTDPTSTIGNHRGTALKLVVLGAAAAALTACTSTSGETAPSPTSSSSSTIESVTPDYNEFTEQQINLESQLNASVMQVADQLLDAMDDPASKVVVDTDYNAEYRKSGYYSLGNLETTIGGDNQDGLPQLSIQYSTNENSGTNPLVKILSGDLKTYGLTLDIKLGGETAYQLNQDIKDGLNPSVSDFKAAIDSGESRVYGISATDLAEQQANGPYVSFMSDGRIYSAYADAQGGNHERYVPAPEEPTVIHDAIVNLTAVSNYAVSNIQ